MRVTLLTVLVGVLLSAAPALGDGKTPTIAQSLELKSGLAPQLSPDGKCVAYEIRETDWDADAFKREIWLVETATGARYQLTRSAKGSGEARWSPDGTRLAFISDRGGQRQVYAIRPRGGEAAPLTRMPTGVTRFEWSPDGRRIAVTARDPEPSKRRERPRDGAILDGDSTPMHLWVVDVPQGDGAPGAARRLTEGGRFSVAEFSWSPDGRRIACSAGEKPDLPSWASGDLYVVDVATKAVRKVVEGGGPNTNPVWSPDGRQLAYQTFAGKAEYSYRNQYVAVVCAEGGPPRVLTGAFDERAYLAGWGTSGVYFFALQKTDMHLFRVSPATKVVVQVSRPQRGVFGPFSFDRASRHVAFVMADATNYGEVCVAEVEGFQPKRLTALGEQLRPFRLASREVIGWKSADGTPIEGVLVKPADFDPSRKYPLLVLLHGGPAGADWPTLEYDRYYPYPVEQFAAKGALLLRPNYRGSGGYGERFRSRNVRGLGVADGPDVIAGVDHLIRRGWVDPGRVAAMGHSYGGSLCAFLATTSRRFKALEVDAGVADWALNYGTTDHPPFAPHLLRATPWDDPDIYRKVSAITYLKTARTPTLIQHGEVDRRVSLANASLLSRGLKDQGVAVKLVVHRGVGHSAERPKAQRAMQEQTFAWFSRWIWDEDEPEKR
jgi:dipeptidyl aminopeptidase/acylaminoacyl peptidase